MTIRANTECLTKVGNQALQINGTTTRNNLGRFTYLKTYYEQGRIAPTKKWRKLCKSHFHYKHRIQVNFRYIFAVQAILIARIAICQTEIVSQTIEIAVVESKSSENTMQKQYMPPNSWA